MCTESLKSLPLSLPSHHNLSVNTRLRIHIRIRTLTFALVVVFVLDVCMLLHVCVCVFVCQDFAHFLCCCCCSICWPFVPGCKQQAAAASNCPQPQTGLTQQQQLWLLKHCESLGFTHCTQLQPKWNHKCSWHYQFGYSYVPSSRFRLYRTRTTASIVVGTNAIQ